MVQKKDANGSWFSWLVSFERFTFDHGHPGQEWISQITDDEALRRHEKNKKVYAKVKDSKDKETLLQYIYIGWWFIFCMMQDACMRKGSFSLRLDDFDSEEPLEDQAVTNLRTLVILTLNLFRSW